MICQRQFESSTSALLYLHNNEATTIYSAEPQLAASEVEGVVTYLKQEPVYRSGASQWLPACSWVKPGLELHVENKLLGVWLPLCQYATMGVALDESASHPG